ncbi:CPBP family intramembrane glutamic endopeptidase [Halobacillus sp. BBL2006]|uniref:CPBP family intramembrane glutamic endopeptidase n=1 Tax=Halobacillus sp. BBL2006 TaxID=1543706 RepID=UPI000542253C|nr:CPBP family intramembrane glutamic endopeptidase [Halobacillus sp. BBL2006]KHE73198.1 hypothetical protein LD39_00555 [Halobacillus sp. BBL2006]
MKESNVGIKNIKLWLIIPVMLCWEVPVFFMNITFEFTSVTTEVLDILFYLFVLVWISMELSRKRIKFSHLSANGKPKIPWMRILAFVPIVKLTAAAMLLVLGMGILLSSPSLNEIPIADARLQQQLQLLPTNLILKFMMVVIIAPIVEELFFRGMMLNKFTLKHGALKGILGTSVLFTMVHPLSFFSAFLMSIFLSIVYLKTRKMYVPIIVHAFGNLIVLLNQHLLSPLLFSGEQTESLPEKAELLAMSIIATALLSITIFGFYKWYPRRESIHL